MSDVPNKHCASEPTHILASLADEILVLLALEVKVRQSTGKGPGRHMAVLVARLQAEASMQDEGALELAEDLVQDEVMRRWLAERQKRPVPLVENDVPIGHERGGDDLISFDNRCGVRGRVESRMDRRCAREIEINISCPALAGGTAAQARKLAYTLLSAADAAEVSAQAYQLRAGTR